MISSTSTHNKNATKDFGLLDLSQSGHQLVWGPLLIGEFFLLRHGEFLKVDEKWEKYALLLGTLSSTTPRRNRARRNIEPWLATYRAAGRKPVW
jgi:hypothetical protein